MAIGTLLGGGCAKGEFFRSLLSPTMRVQTNSVLINPENMRVQEIFFSQSSVSATFSDGTTLEEARRRLREGEIRVEDFPPIRIVYFEGRWITLDNRRLRVFKDAGVNFARVMKCDGKDLAIAKEFWTKRSVKSLEGGGVIRAEMPDLQVSQNQGIYKFNKRVLNWTLEQMQQPFRGDALSRSYSTREEYYRCFESLIFEEARAILQKGLEQAAAQGACPLQFALEKFKRAKNPENPTEIKFTVLSGSTRDIKPVDVFLFQSEQHPHVRFIALANYSEQTPDDLQLSFKCVVDRGLQEVYPLAFTPGSKWNSTSIGSLVSLQRMYDAVTSFHTREETVIEKSIFTGTPGIPPVVDGPISTQERELLASLNISQREAVEKCLRINEGLQLIQGPPGTGKTTTVLKLLRALQQRGERILICGPSNKAVQVLAEQFIKGYPDVPVVLVGVEGSLPIGSPLRRIFFDTWCAQQENFLQRVSDALSHIQQNLAIHNRETVDQLGRDFSRWVDEIAMNPALIHMGLLEKKAAFLKGIMDYNNSIASQITSQNSIETTTEISVLSNVISSLMGKFQTPDMEIGLLQHARVLFMTLSIAGQQRLKQMMGPIDTLIVDEAGQAVEAETLIPLRTFPKKCVLVGDTRQLPATVFSQEAEKLKFGRSMMERLEECGYPTSMLTTQYRMHPAISSWPSRRFYQGKLKNDCSVSNLVMPRSNKIYPFLAPYAFIDIEGSECVGSSGSSFVNHQEINNALLIIKYFKEAVKVVNKIAVITFYKAQADAIRERLGRGFPQICVNTVDGFQGGESDIVIISCVRANLQQQIGFLKECKRLNVALTRAKYSLIIIGNADTLMRNDLAELVQDAKERGYFYPGSVLRQLSFPVTRSIEDRPLKGSGHSGTKRFRNLK